MHLETHTYVALAGGRYIIRGGMIECGSVLCQRLIQLWVNITANPINLGMPLNSSGKDNPDSRVSKAKAPRASVLGTADGWAVISDLETQLVVPREIAITSLRPEP